MRDARFNEAGVERGTGAPGTRGSACSGLTRAPPEVLGVLLRDSLRRYELLHDVTRAGGVDLDARAHGRGHRDRADVAALGRRGLGPDQLVDHRGVVLEQRAILEV